MTQKVQFLQSPAEAAETPTNVYIALKFKVCIIRGVASGIDR